MYWAHSLDETIKNEDIKAIETHPKKPKEFNS